MTPSVRKGANSLAKARYFLDRVREEEGRDPWNLLALGSNLEAALVFAKSLQDALAEEAGCGKGGPKERWLKRVGLWNEPVSAYLAGERDLAVHHDGTVTLSRGQDAVMYVTSPATAFAAAGAVAVYIQHTAPTPWLKVQNRRIRQQALKNQARVQARSDRNIQSRIRLARREAARAAARTPAQPRPFVHFNHPDPAIGTRRATVVIGEYLDRLERIRKQPVSFGT